MVDSQVSLLDIVPTVLDWFKVPYPHYSIFKKQGKVKLTGRSLLDHLSRQEKMERVGEILLLNIITHVCYKAIFGSHILHEVTMYYPMRSVRTKR